MGILRVIIITLMFLLSCSTFFIENEVKADYTPDLYFCVDTFKLEKNHDEDWTKVSADYKTSEDWSLDVHVDMKCVLWKDDVHEETWWSLKSMEKDDQFTIFCKRSGTDWECGGIALDYYEELTETDEDNNWKWGNEWEEAVEVDSDYIFTFGVFNPVHSSSQEFSLDAYFSPSVEGWSIEVFPLEIEPDPDESEGASIYISTPEIINEYPDIIAVAEPTDNDYSWAYQDTTIHLESGSQQYIEEILQTIKWIDKYISELDDNKFDKKPENRKEQFHKKLIENEEDDSVIELINIEEYEDALDNLQNVYKRLDGETSPKDWIVSSPEKIELKEIFSHTINTLEQWFV